MSGLTIDDPVTLEQAVRDKNIIPGDTVLLLPGVYTTALELKISGTQEAPITFQPYNGGEIILRPSSGYRVLHCDKVHDLIFKNIIIDAVNVDTEPVKVDNGAERIVFDGCEMLNGKTGGISIHGETTLGCEVKNCTIHDIGTNTFHHGIYIAQGADGDAIGNEIYNCSGHGIHVWGLENPDSVIRILQNYIHDVGTRGVGCYYGNQIVVNNIVRNCGTMGIALMYYLTSARCYFNTVVDSLQFNIFIDGLTGESVDFDIANIFCLNAGLGVNIYNSMAEPPPEILTHNNLDGVPENHVDNGGVDIYPTENATGLLLPDYSDDYNGKARVIPTIGAIER